MLVASRRQPRARLFDPRERDRNRMFAEVALLTLRAGARVREVRFADPEADEVGRLAADPTGERRLVAEQRQHPTLPDVGLAARKRALPGQLRDGVPVKDVRVGRGHVSFYQGPPDPTLGFILPPMARYTSART